VQPFDRERRYTLGRGLKAARKARGLSADKAAFLISLHGVKCSKRNLLSWEQGQGREAREPHASDLPVIALVYCCEIAVFFNPPMSVKWTPFFGPRG
jgi:transcriptional regulator with XRE-family HTH domain